MTSTTNLLDQKSNSKYDEFDNLISYIQPGRDEGAKYTLFYGETEKEKKKHLPKSATSPLGIGVRPSTTPMATPPRAPRARKAKQPLCRVARRTLPTATTQ